MSHACINAAAVRVKAADDHVVKADECSEHAHRRDQPKRCVSSDGESQHNHIGLARPPVAVKNCRRALPIHIARPLNVCWYQLIRLKRSVTRATRRLTSRSRISRHPLPFNDADEVSCRAGAIKCSRCRASFAPIHTALADRIWFPRWNGHSPSIKRNKELEKPSDRVESQSSQSWPRNNLPVDKCAMDSHTR